MFLGTEKLPESFGIRLFNCAKAAGPYLYLLRSSCSLLWWGPSKDCQQIVELRFCFGGKFDAATKMEDGQKSKGLLYSVMIEALRRRLETM